MGPHYLHTLVYQYLAAPDRHATKVNLKRQSIIIDANSFMYFIYDTMLKDKKINNGNRLLTEIPFDYDGYWNSLSEVLTRFKEECSTVCAVFDGVFKRNANRRPDPDCTSSLLLAEFNANRNQLPSLFRHEFLNILGELDIDIIVARGEADPMIACLAQDRNAYVVAADSDYHLYGLPLGYIPLKFFNLKAFKGPLYKRNDVFTRMNEDGVALWTSLIKYDFVDLTKLQKSLWAIQPFDGEQFESWLESTKPDDQKRNLITTEWLLLRFIQQVGSKTAYQQLIQLVNESDRTNFDQVRLQNIRVIPLDSIKTKNRRELPRCLDNLFITGNLDHTILNILISRNVLKNESMNNPVYFELLLPIIQILLNWDCPTGEIDNDSQKVIFNGQSYEPLAEIKITDLPSPDEISKMSLTDRKNWLLRCVQLVLQSLLNTHPENVHDNHLAWLYLLKLWWHKGKERTTSKKLTLYAMIVSYFTHTLLQEQDESENCRQSTKETSISEPFLQYSKKKLKKYFSSDMRSSLNKKINRNASVYAENENIKADLHEAEEFYNIFYMINQFFHLPFIIPKAHEYVSQQTYYLAIAFTKSNTIETHIKISLLGQNPILVGLFEEITSWVTQVHRTDVDVNERSSK